MIVSDNETGRNRSVTNGPILSRPAAVGFMIHYRNTSYGSARVCCCWVLWSHQHEQSKALCSHHWSTRATSERIGRWRVYAVDGSGEEMGAKRVDLSSCRLYQILSPFSGLVPSPDSPWTNPSKTAGMGPRRPVETRWPSGR